MQHDSDHDPFGAAAVAFVTSLAVAFLFVSMFAAATLLDFPPMKGLKALDDSLAQLLWEPPGPEAGVDVTPIYFVDIDDKSIEAYAQEKHEDLSHFVGKSTPRDFVADLLRRVRQNNPAVVVLDIDLRDPRDEPGDRQLRNELEKTDNLPIVLIPRIIYPDQLTTCSKNLPTLETAHAGAFQTMMEDAINPAKVMFVHPYFELDWLGDVKGICPSLKITNSVISGTTSLELKALSVEAVGHTRLNENPPHRWWFLEEQVTGNMQRVQFRVGGNRRNPLYAGSKTEPLYRQVPAFYVGDKDLSPSDMAGAIVIIGTSHMGVAEYHSTPVGRMPGAVVHANIMLQLQIGPVAELPFDLQRIIKIVLCIGLAIIHARVYVYNIARDRSSGLQRFVLHFKCFALATVLTLAITFIYYSFIIPHMVPDAVAVMGPIVMVCAEVLYEVIKLVENLFDRYGRYAVDLLMYLR